MCIIIDNKSYNKIWHAWMPVGWLCFNWNLDVFLSSETTDFIFIIYSDESLWKCYKTEVEKKKLAKFNFDT